MACPEVGLYIVALYKHTNVLGGQVTGGPGCAGGTSRLGEGAAIMLLTSPYVRTSGIILVVYIFSRPIYFPRTTLALPPSSNSVVYIFSRPIYFPRTTLALPPSSNSDPGSHSGPSSLFPTAVRAFIFTAKRIPRFLLSSTRVELCILTHAPSRSQQLILFLAFLQTQPKSHLQWESNSRANATSIRRQPLDHLFDRYTRALQFHPVW